jgi:hypothetical protein
LVDVQGAKEEEQDSGSLTAGPDDSVFPMVRSMATNIPLKSRAAAVLVITVMIAEP